MTEMATTDSVQRQVRLASLEAAFALIVTLAVCVWVEWGHGTKAMAMAVAIPGAMAFCVHGLHNATGLGWRNIVYVPLRVAGVVIGLGYSYSHYLAMLPDNRLLVAGWDIRPVAAVTVELLTISALIAHEGHSARLLTSPSAPQAVLVVKDEGATGAAVEDRTDEFVAGLEPPARSGTDLPSPSRSRPARPLISSPEPPASRRSDLPCPTGATQTPNQRKHVRSIPVDTDEFHRLFRAVGSMPKLKRNDEGKFVPDANADGIPKWHISGVYMNDDASREGDFEKVKVGFTGTVKPDVATGERVILHGLKAGAYATDSGQAGVWVACDAVQVGETMYGLAGKREEVSNGARTAA